MKNISQKEKNIPHYLQIYENLKKEIINGNYQFGAKIPSKRNMSAESGLSLITVKHAYELLVDEGYIEARERSGYFVIFRKEDGFVYSRNNRNKITEHDNSLKSEFSFPFSVLTKAMRRTMNNYGEYILEKSSNKGNEELRNAIRLYLARNRNIHADLDQIIIGAGSEYLYNMIIGIFGTDDIFALEYPSYEKIEKVYRISGIKCDMLKLGEEGIESAELAETRASILHISPYRSFPSGITASASKKYEYIRWAKKASRFIVEDDFESEFSISKKPEETMFAMSDNDNVIYINTFSKTISRSLRLGYMVLPKSLVKAFDDKLGFYSCTVPTFEQLVIAELINSGDFEKHINRVRRTLRKRLSENLNR